MADLWKEYCYADSRYACGESFIVTMEAVTGFLWGPLCFVIAYGMATSATWRYPLMLVVSLGQWYGCVLYFLTTIYEGTGDVRPEPIYFYGYFIAMNLIWIFVPMLAMWHAGHRVALLTRAGERESGFSRKGAGKGKKKN